MYTVDSPIETRIFGNFLVIPSQSLILHMLEAEVFTDL